MLLGEHSAILLTLLSYHLSLRSLFCLFLRGRFTQVLQYADTFVNIGQPLNIYSRNKKWTKFSGKKYKQDKVKGLLGQNRS